jgi:hypothetical protein
MKRPEFYEIPLYEVLICLGELIHFLFIQEGRATIRGEHRRTLDLILLIGESATPYPVTIRLLSAVAKSQFLKPRFIHGVHRGAPQIVQTKSRSFEQNGRV